MTVQKDIWGWLYASDREHGNNEANTQVQVLMNARRSQDAEGARVAKENLEALALRRGQSWLGVFGRHWDLQLRVCDLKHGASAVPDAVKAFELSTRPENRDCPQSICTVQDLCIAFTATDGPGYADQVIATCEDTLERIDPSWPCFDCIRGELAEGLLHNSEGQRVLDLAQETEKLLRSGGVTPSSNQFAQQIEAMILVDPTAAAEFALTFDERRFIYHGEFSKEVLELQIAEALVSADRLPEALERLGTWPDPIERPGVSISWSRFVAKAVASEPLLNTLDRRATAIRLAQQLYSDGAYRQAFETSVMAGLWSAAVGAKTNAERCLGLAIEVSEHLIKPVDAPQLILKLETALLQLSQGAVSEGAVSQGAVSQGAVSEEDRRFEVLEERAATGQLEPEDVHELGRLRSKQGWPQLADSLVLTFADQDLANVSAVLSAAATLLGNGQVEQVQALAERVIPEDSANGHWLHAMAAFQSSDWDAACSRAERVVEFDNSALNARRLWAQAARNLGDFAAASRLRCELLDMAPEADEHQHTDAWAATVDGSAAQDWGLVRRAAKLLGIELIGDSGAPHNDGEHIVVVSTDDRGRGTFNVATRTGPATARVIQVAHPQQPLQSFGNEVAFDPIPLNPEEGSSEPRRYKTLATLSFGQYESVLVQGASATAQQATDFIEQIRGAGWAAWSYSNPFEDSEGNQHFPIYLAVAVGGESDEAALADLLTEATADWSSTVVWPMLLKRLGLSTEDHDKQLQQHYALLYGEDE